MTLSGDLQFHDEGLAGGIWSGRIEGAAAPPRVVLVHRGAVIAEARLRDDPAGGWRIEAALPGAALDDGAHSFLLLADTGEAGAPPDPGALELGALSVIAGRPLDADLRAEIALLRAELDLLKRSLRALANR